MDDAGFPQGPGGQVDLPSIVLGSELVPAEGVSPEGPSEGWEVGPIHLRCQCGDIIRLGRAPTVGEVGVAAERHRRIKHRVVTS